MHLRTLTLTLCAAGVRGLRLPVRMATVGAGVAAPPSWEALSGLLRATGREDYEAVKARVASGEAGPHTDAKVRLFGAKPEDVRVTLYRDTAAWCPYCQKTWMLLEEKRIPFRVEKINMRSYGPKPRSFLDKVPNGLLPAIELDGQLMTDSQRIMMTLENTFTEPQYEPEGYLTLPLLREDPDKLARAERLLGLERELFSWWCQWCFRPGDGPGGAHRKGFEDVLGRVDAALGEADGPFFLGEKLSIVDLVYVPHLERIVSSMLYWKAFVIRRLDAPAGDRYANINRWFDALERRPNGVYLATQSDHFTHVKDIPPQYGDGYFGGDYASARGQAIIAAVDGGVDRDPGAAPGASQGVGGILDALLGGGKQEENVAAAAADGVPDDWSLPLPPLTRAPLVVLPENDPGDEENRLQAAERLVANHEAVTRFALRGAGQPGRPQYQAPLADPNAEPAEDPALAAAVDELLRSVAAQLITGEAAAVPSLVLASQGELGLPAAECMDYLRARVGVPRDMRYPAARAFRASLAWAMEAAASL
mmetsp:Transcript_4092/g.11947  ORF Transcript_4092/g.11947 Transcript_4092/m.11947 type:complete len:536 (-) Transcript_4092:48-1655(-)